MKLTVDPEVDAFYLRLNEAKIVDSEQVASGVVLDYDAEDNVVGVEVLHLSKRGGPVEVEKPVFEILRSHQREATAVRETSLPYGTKSHAKRKNDAPHCARCPPRRKLGDTSALENPTSLDDIKLIARGR
jgi:uncharacterized protein YuzE